MLLLRKDCPQILSVVRHSFVIRVFQCCIVCKMSPKPTVPDTALQAQTTQCTACMQAQAALTQDKEAFEREKDLMQTVPAADNDIVNLNVGGTLLSTKRSTLTQVFTTHRVAAGKALSQCLCHKCTLLQHNPASSFESQYTLSSLQGQQASAYIGTTCVTCSLACCW